MAYRAEFSISRIGASASGPSDRARLLLEVKDYLLEKINKDDDSPTAVESETADNYAYADINAERYYNDKLWRLAVRLYANEDELRAEVFSGVALEDGAVSSISAPKFMRELAERYECRVGPQRIGAAAPAKNELARLLFSPERKLPVLMVSKDPSGRLPYGDIDRLSGQLLGMAQVVEAPPRGRYRTEWGSRFETYNGAARIVWPGARPHFAGRGKGGFYRPGGSGVSVISEIVSDLDENSSPESFDREFVAVNIACIRFRNEQLRSHAQVDESTELKRLQRRTRRAEIERDRLERALDAEKSERIDAENRLDTALRDVARLEEELERASQADGLEKERDEIRNLKDERDSLADTLSKRDDTIQKLNDELQRYRQSARLARNGQNGLHSLIGDTTKNPGQLSLVGHGLNIMRDPVRKFIIKNLSNGIAFNYGLDDIGSALDRVGADKHRYDNYASELDFGNFRLVVASYAKCFGENAYHLSDKLGRIQTYRNRTIHPTFEESTATQRSKALLTDISEVLGIIGELEEVEQVEELKSAL